MFSIQKFSLVKTILIVAVMLLIIHSSSAQTKEAIEEYRVKDSVAVTKQNLYNMALKTFIDSAATYLNPASELSNNPFGGDTLYIEYDYNTAENAPMVYKGHPIKWICENPKGRKYPHTVICAMHNDEGAVFTIDFNVYCIADLHTTKGIRKMNYNYAVHISYQYDCATSNYVLVSEFMQDFNHGK